ncbi:outer membrane beta-barrel protein [Ferruginibacter sp. SUN106]|uniref:outer membrane beta-barrel protein n=1 Tax=Ferruginibacter sp. SUN106 TaxID=2978348 RepID=UPI003D367FDB
MRRLVLSLCLTVGIFAAKAQVKGTVIDSASKKPIDKAVVGLVIKTNPTDTTYTFTNDKGEFNFDVVPASNFSVIITNSGFAPVAKFVPVKQQEKTISIGTVVLASRAKLLDEVIVESAPIIVKEDTVEYRADAFKTKEGAVVEDLLKKLPGIDVDKDGNVKAQGKSVTRVKVNGKDFFGGDLKTATKELPANIVDKIQVIDDYGDQATVSGIKDGDPDKVINIQLKKDKNKGFFGRATVGAGTQDRYLGSFNGNYFNNNTQISLVGNSNNTNASLFNFGGGGNRGMSSMIAMGGGGGIDMSQFGGGGNSGITATNSTGLNYRDQWGKRVSVYGSYSYSHRNTSQLQSISSQNNSANGTFINQQDANSLTTGGSHRATFNVEYQIDSFNYLKVTPNFSYSNSDGNSNTVFNNTKTGSGKTTDGSNKNLSDSKSPNLSVNVLYNHKFRKRGRNFSASGSLGNSSSNSTQDATNLSYYYQGPFIGPKNIFQYIDQQNDNHNYGVRFTYSEPINKYRSLDLSYSHNLNYARNDKKTYNVDSLTQFKTMNGLLSNDYENDFYNNRIGLSLRTTMKKYNYTLGVSVQPVDLQGKSITKDSAYKSITRVNIFPIARLVYNFSRTKAINATYSGNATQPTFTQLQPVVDSTNIQNVVIGNPNLKPSITQNINLTYNSFNLITGKVLFTALNFSTIKNQIINNSIINKSTGYRTSLPQNVNGYYNLTGFYNFSKPFKNRKYVFSLNGSANFNHNINLTDDIKTIGQNWVLSQGFGFEYNLKEWLQLGSGVNYSLNDVKYKSTSDKPTTFVNSSSNAWTLTNNINVNATKRLVLKYDLDYTMNNGLANSVSQNPVLMNASLEQQLFKKKNGIIKFAAYDLFKQNTNISRSIYGSSITDTRTNKLTRYFLLTFTYRIQKFVGQAAQGGNMRSMGGPAMRMF